MKTMHPYDEGMHCWLSSDQDGQELPATHLAIIEPDGSVRIVELADGHLLEVEGDLRRLVDTAQETVLFEGSVDRLLGFDPSAGSFGHDALVLDAYAVQPNLVFALPRRLFAPIGDLTRTTLPAGLRIRAKLVFGSAERTVTFALEQAQSARLVTQIPWQQPPQLSNIVFEGLGFERKALWRWAPRATEESPKPGYSVVLSFADDPD
jgi:hypothetical protein